MLGENGWELSYRLTFDLELNWAECEYLTGNLASAEERLSTLSVRALTILDSASVTCARLNLYTHLDQSDSAVAVASTTSGGSTAGGGCQRQRKTSIEIMITCGACLVAVRSRSAADDRS